MPNHWTDESIQAYKYSICSDFISFVQGVVDANSTSMRKIASVLNISKSEAQLLFDRPSNLTIEQMITIAKFLELDVGIVAYNNYPNNERGPVNGNLFRKSWEENNRPQDFFE